MEQDTSQNLPEWSSDMMLKSINRSMERLVAEVSDMAETLEVLSQELLGNTREMT